MLQYISPREPIYTILFIHCSPVRCARAQLYTRRVCEADTTFLVFSLPLLTSPPPQPPRRSTNTTHTRFARGDHRAPPNGATSAPPCSAGVSSFVFRAAVPCVLFRRAAHMMTESRDVGGRRIRYVVPLRHHKRKFADEISGGRGLSNICSLHYIMY